MLKIKDNVDLKELEKYGFRKLLNQQPTYLKQLEFISYHISEAEDREIKIGTEEYTPTLDNTLYDMIQDKIVEKVE